MICHRNFATKWHSVFEDKDLKLSKETITNKTVCGYGVANQKSFYFIKNDDREFLSIEDLVNAYNEKFKFEYENPDQEVIYVRVVKKNKIMKYSIELQGKRKEIQEYLGQIEDKEKMSKKMSDIINYKVRLLEIGFSPSEDFRNLNKKKS